MIALKDEVSKLESERLNLQSEAETLTEERNQLKEQYVQLEKQSDIRCQAYQSMSNSREPIKNQIEKIKSDIADIITVSGLPPCSMNQSKLFFSLSAVESRLFQL